MDLSQKGGATHKRLGTTDLGAWVHAGNTTHDYIIIQT